MSFFASGKISNHPSVVRGRFSRNHFRCLISSSLTKARNSSSIRSSSFSSSSEYCFISHSNRNHPGIFDTLLQMVTSSLCFFIFYSIVKELFNAWQSKDDSIKSEKVLRFPLCFLIRKLLPEFLEIQSSKVLNRPLRELHYST